MFKLTQALLGSAVLLLIGCGGGSSSGGRGGEAAKDCIETKSSEDFRNFGITFTNTCSFGVNVRDLAEDPNTGEIDPPFAMRANSSVFRDDEIIIFYGACRRPSVPQPREAFEYSCS